MPFSENRREAWDSFWNDLAANPPHGREASEITGEDASDIQFDTSGRGVREGAGPTDALWNDLMSEIEQGGTATMDAFLAGEGHQAGGTHYEGVRGLTDSVKRAKAGGRLFLGSRAGTRVAFKGGLEAMLTYSAVPPDGTEGSIVKVKAGGVTTHHGGRIFVEFDNGETMGVEPQHLRLASEQPQAQPKAQAQTHRRRVASLGDLSGFFGPVSRGGKVSNDTLVHKSTKDLWSLRKDGEAFVIEQMFQDDGSPLKV